MNCINVTMYFVVWNQTDWVDQCFDSAAGPLRRMRPISGIVGKVLSTNTNDVHSPPAARTPSPPVPAPKDAMKSRPAPLSLGQ
jgi:hypothetical protein